MLVKTRLIEQRDIEKNIELPYYSKKGDTFYRINENESVLRIIVDPSFSYQMDLFLKSPYSDAHCLDQAVIAQPCSAEEVETAVRRYLQFVGSTVELLAAETV